MNIAIIGAGAIGSVIAAYLSKAGVDVTLIGRPNQVEAIQKNGLHVKGAQGEENIKLTAKTKLDRSHDLTIFTTKTQDMEAAYQENHQFLIEDSTVLTTQNGVQADNILSTHFEKENAISSIVMFGATYINPGEIVYNFPGSWIIGQPYVTNHPFVHEVADVLKKAFDVFVSDDIMGMKWLKLFVNFNNCIPALTGKSMQQTFDDIDLCKLSIMLLKEGFAVTQKASIHLVSLPSFPAERIVGLVEMPLDQAAQIINKTLTTLSKEPLYGSILQSLMRKRTSEIDYINGEIALLAKHVGIQAPLNRKIVDLVHEVESSGQFMDSSVIKKEFSLN